MIIQSLTTGHSLDHIAVSPHRRGIQLMPVVHECAQPTISVKDLYELPTSLFFLDTSSVGIGGNPTCVKLNVVDSARDLIGKQSTDFYKSESALRHIYDDKMALKNQALHISSDTSVRKDGEAFDFIHFKMPWYQNNNVMGVFGFSLEIDSANIHKFTHLLSRILAMEIINQHQAAPLILQDQSQGKIYFSEREQQVLRYLVRGRTARQIAVTLRLSVRTVEHHIQRMKDKSNSASKYELIDKYFDLLK